MTDEEVRIKLRNWSAFSELMKSNIDNLLYNSFITIYATLLKFFPLCSICLLYFYVSVYC